MKLLIAIVQDGFVSMYGSSKSKGKQVETDIEEQFHELEQATDNPRVRETLEYWKNFVKEKRYYGLLVVIDNDQNKIEYLPLPTSKDSDDFIGLTKKELGYIS